MERTQFEKFVFECDATEQFLEQLVRYHSKEDLERVFESVTIDSSLKEIARSESFQRTIPEIPRFAVQTMRAFNRKITNFNNV